MFNFEFHNPTRILFGKNQVECIGKYIPGDATVLITYGGGSAKKSGLLDKVKNALGSRTVYEFGGIEPNPKYATLVKAVEMVRSKNVNFLLAVGGGSVIDGTKFIALASCYNGDSRDLLNFAPGMIPLNVASKSLPIGTVLTLPATGSEMNSGAVVSDEHGKYPVLCNINYPVFSVLDPTLTFTLPKIQVANGIIDTFVHTTEQYLTYPVDGRIQDRFAEGILQTLIEIGQKALEEPENYDVRANFMWCATLGLNGLIGAGVPQDWATHMIGHELTFAFGIDHGQTLAIVLPALLEVRRKQKRAKLLQYAERVWSLRHGAEEERIDLAIQTTREFFESLGVKTRLSQYGVGIEQISGIVEQLMSHRMTALSETGDITPEISREILQRAL
jgi:NADP-dependent alcohol dehydrogenase